MIRRAAFICLALAFIAIDGTAADRAALEKAQSLAWAKKFDEAARIYLQVLHDDPSSRDARLGLARVRLWQGRYAEARDLFEELVDRNARDVDAAEGAATAAYWSGDYRTAEREFRAIAASHPNRETVQRSLSELRSASRGTESIETSLVDDDQPFRALRTQLGWSMFSDPLTRWDIHGGDYLIDSTAGGRHHVPFVLLRNETVMPAWRLTVTPSLGAIHMPDGKTSAIGGLAALYRLAAHDSLSLSFERREMVSNATQTYPFVNAGVLRWQHSEPWLASIGVERDRFTDHNSASAADAYILWPVTRMISVGASAMARDTEESRFIIESITATRDPSGQFFHYTYRGAYDPYWTPHDLVEGRLIVAIARRISTANVRLQADGGYARDRAVVFWPESDRTPFPTQIGQSLFNRSYNPWRLRLTAAVPIGLGFTIDAGYEYSATAFYRANTFHAALARRR